MSASSDFSLIQPGMDVYSTDAELLGQVQEVRSSGFMLHRAKGEPRFIPGDAVGDVIEGERRVDLTIVGSEIDSIDWKNPAP